MATATTTPTTIGSSACLLQNLGPDNLYVGNSDSSGNPLVTSTNGFRLAAGQSVAVTNGSTETSIVSEGSSEYRILNRGIGVFADATTP